MKLGLAALSVILLLAGCARTGLLEKRAHEGDGGGQGGAGGSGKNGGSGGAIGAGEEAVKAFGSDF